MVLRGMGRFTQKIPMMPTNTTLIYAKLPTLLELFLIINGMFWLFI